MRLLLLVAGLLVALPLAAEARMHAPYRGHRIVASGTAPLDTFATPAAAYSLRKLKSTYAGPAIRLRRASDNAEQDIGFLGFTGFTGAPIDTAAANAHCAATTCRVVTIYDQSGNARHAPQTPASQPDYIANCNGTSPCVRTAGAGIGLASASVTWAAAINSLSTVARRAAGTGLCGFIMKNLNHIGSNTANDWWTTAFSGGLIEGAAADNVWHAASSVINGVSSVLRIDAVETAGNVVADGGAGAAQFNNGAASTTCDVVEGIIWDGYTLTAGERTALQQNQKSFWGTP